VLTHASRQPLPWLISNVGQKMKPRVLAFLFLTLALHAAETPEQELARLEKAFSSARTQWDMNETSGELAKYWDRALEKEEAKILASCDAERAKLFRNAQKSWREYRLAETKLQGDSYRGGSIQPMIHNTTFASITAQRVKELRSMSESP
jgi:uncharacterized protein YecT (DUF1311 family)